ncbi:MAG: hypothetical protein HYS09_04990 [Chloroflexi bacterium]|nr:hypothetical protein [Chloroflexota bacterium]
MAHRPRSLIISHAACAGLAPENTLAGVRAALELGADAVEVDVHASADGVPVLIHDPTVDRTTDGSGPVSSFTLDQIQRLDAGAKAFDGAFRGERVPTLAGALALTRGKALLVAEIKEPGIEEQVARVIAESDALDDVIVWSFLSQVLSSMRRAEPRLPCALLVSHEGVASWPSLARLAVQLGLQGVSVYHQGISEDLVRHARRRALSLYAWTVDTAEEVRRLAALGIDGIVTNDPGKALAALD